MIRLVKSTFYHEAETAKALAEFVTSTEKLSFGQECESFEQAFAQYQGRKHCVLVNSGSSANLALIQALRNLGRLAPNDPVGFSAVTWATNVMPLIQLGLQPVPVDIELDTLNVSSRSLSAALRESKLKALFLTNLLGFCDDIDEIARVCEAEGILLIEDNCESLGTVYRGTKLGNFGTASTFSFYVGHHMSTIEGGAICTDDEELATMLRIVRAHGWDRNLSLADQEALRSAFQVNSTFYSRYTFYDLGYNLRPTEIAGFLGNNQLRYLDEIVQKRAENFSALATDIYGQTDLYHPLRYDHIELVSNFAVPVVCRTASDRDALVAACDEKVEIRPIVGGHMVQQPFFQKYIPEAATATPNAQLVHENGLYFGNNPELSPDDLQLLRSIFVTAEAKVA